MIERIYLGIVALVVFLFVYMALATGETSFAFLIDAVVFDSMFWPFLFLLIPAPVLAVKNIFRVSAGDLMTVTRVIVYTTASVILIIGGYNLLLGIFIWIIFIGG